jgi:hypothetical protein
MKTIWHRLAQFFEDGDLTPFAVLISIVHYGDVLAAHGEHAIVAYAIGTLVDLIHFRTIRRAFMPHNNRQETIVNWLVAAITTFMASMYHWRFYEGDYLLALPIPVGIAILAYHAAKAKMDHRPINHWRNRARWLIKLARRMQADLIPLRNDVNSLQTTIATLQADNNDLRDRIKEQQAFMKLWRKLGKDGRTIVQAIAGEITKEQATEQTGWDVRTVGTYIDRMNGGGK